MKVLVKNEFEQATATVTCHKCKSVLEVSESDAKYSRDDRDPTRYITCPVCKTQQVAPSFDRLSDQRQ